jgi:16S rRNA (cytidine1402-2'-O)-methyltransferase
MTTPKGTLFLMPNTLDFGCDAAHCPDIELALPRGVLEQAAQLTYWVAENAKTTRAFLKRVHAVRPLAAALQDIHIAELPRPLKGQASPLLPDARNLLQPLLEGHDVGLISEAGLPGVADPGAALVQAAHDAAIRVQALSGPSALMLALAASGLQGQCFAFVGYLPVDSTQRTARLRELEGLSKRQQQTQLLIETPYRNTSVWAAMLQTLHSTTRLSVSCGLTLPQGFSVTRTVSQWKKFSLQLPENTPAVFCFLAHQPSSAL